MEGFTAATPYLVLLLSGASTVMWWLVRQQMESRKRDIDLLWEKHDEDAKALQELRIQIASQHYVKGELDAKFDRLDATFRTGFADMASKFDKLADVLQRHITDEGHR